jgi:hypothetical protein
MANQQGRVNMAKEWKYTAFESFLERKSKEFVLDAIETDFPYLMQPFLRKKWADFRKKVIEAEIL